MRINKLRVVVYLLGVVCFIPLHAQELTLDSCRNMALKHNKGSQISNETLLAAQEARKAAFTNFLPSINATGGWLHNSKNINLLSDNALLPVGSIASDGSFTYSMDDILTMEYGGQTVPINSAGQPTTNPNEFIPKHVAYLPKESMSFDIENIFVAGIGFTQPIFMGGKILSLYRMAQISEDMASISRNNNDVNIMIQVDEAYWRVVSLQKKTDLAHEYNELLKTTYDDVKALYDEGLATNADLLKVQVKFNESEMSVTKAENGLRLSKMYLNQICGMDFNTDYVLQDANQIDLEDISLSSDSITTDVSFRPEAQLLQQNVLLAEQAVNIARSRFMPNIIAQGNYLLSNPNSFNGYEKEFSGMFSFGIAVSIPIFHFGDRIHTLNMAKHNLKIAELTRDESIEKMRLQATMKQNTQNESIKQTTMANNNMLKAEENLRQAQLGFDEGVLSTSDLMEAQTSWVSAKSEVIDARINMMLAKLYLNQSLGKIQVPKIDSSNK